jgi:hypothetical protein
MQKGARFGLLTVMGEQAGNAVPLFGLHWLS